MTTMPSRAVPSLHGDTSLIAAGCWALGGPAINGGKHVGWAPIDDADADAVLQTAWDAGITLFDTADVYGNGLSERRLGRLVRQVPRDRIILASKVGYTSADGHLHPYDPSSMRRRLEGTLTRLGTDHLDVYAYHNDDFGAGDQWLDPALEAMRAFQDEGLVRATSMRAPHEFILDWAEIPGHPRRAETRRFLERFERLEPAFLAARYNVTSVTAGPGQTDLNDFARSRQVSVLAKQVLAQGLLTLAGPQTAAPVYGTGDHRAGKAAFTAAARQVYASHLDTVRAALGIPAEHLASLAVRYAAQTLPGGIVLIGLHTVEQLRQCLHDFTPLPDETLAVLTETGARIRRALDRLHTVHTHP
jgi:aryl-alcohol dehydrogenase-like predicted oxidoreductase